VQFDPNNRPNKFNKSITVTSNASNNIVKLKISGVVIATPNKLRASIGSLKLEKTKINLKGMKDSDVINDSLKIQSSFKQIVNVTFTDKPSLITITPNEVKLQPGERTVIGYTIDAGQKGDYGNFFEKILVTSTTESTSKTGYIYFSGSIKEDFSYYDNVPKEELPIIEMEKYHDLGELVLKQPRDVTIPFSNKGGSMLILRDVELDRYCTLLSYDEKIEPGDTGYIKLSVKPNLARANFNSSLTVISNDPNISTLKVKLTGKIKR